MEFWKIQEQIWKAEEQENSLEQTSMGIIWVDVPVGDPKGEKNSSCLET